MKIVRYEHLLREREIKRDTEREWERNREEQGPSSTKRDRYVYIYIHIYKENKFEVAIQLVCLELFYNVILKTKTYIMWRTEKLTERGQRDS